jgi:hypothetical protein
LIPDDEVEPVTLPDPAAASRLRWFTLALLVVNVIATMLAVAVNLPAQFGGGVPTQARSSSPAVRRSLPRSCPS